MSFGSHGIDDRAGDTHAPTYVVHDAATGQPVGTIALRFAPGVRWIAYDNESGAVRIVLQTISHTGERTIHLPPVTLRPGPTPYAYYCESPERLRGLEIFRPRAG